MFIRLWGSGLAADEAETVTEFESKIATADANNSVQRCCPARLYIAHPEVGFALERSLEFSSMIVERNLSKKTVWSVIFVTLAEESLISLSPRFDRPVRKEGLFPVQAIAPHAADPLDAVDEIEGLEEVEIDEMDVDFAADLIEAFAPLEHGPEQRRQSGRRRRAARARASEEADPVAAESRSSSEVDDRVPDAVAFPRVDGNKIRLGDVVIGTMTLPTHWHPPTRRVQCLHPAHGLACSISAPIEFPVATLLQWVSEASLSSTAQVHMDARPHGTGASRRRSSR